MAVVVEMRRVAAEWVWLYRCTVGLTVPLYSFQSHPNVKCSIPPDPIYLSMPNFGLGLPAYITPPPPRSQVSLPNFGLGLPAYYVLALSEASSNLSRYDGVRYGARYDDAKTLAGMYTGTRGQGLGAEVKRRILMGTYALSSGFYDAYYKQAQQVGTEGGRRGFRCVWSPGGVAVYIMYLKVGWVRECSTPLLSAGMALVPASGARFWAMVLCSPTLMYAPLNAPHRCARWCVTRWWPASRDMTRC